LQVLYLFNNLFYGTFWKINSSILEYCDISYNAFSEVLTPLCAEGFVFDSPLTTGKTSTGTTRTVTTGTTGTTGITTTGTTIIALTASTEASTTGTTGTTVQSNSTFNTPMTIIALLMVGILFIFHH